MPLIRKVLPIGGSKGITLPKSWIEWIERETGKTVVEVAVEVDRVITISPIIPEKGDVSL